MESIGFEVLVILLSALFASFIKCLVDSKDKKRFLFGRSKCESCGTVLTARDLIPIFSYLCTRGKCRYCGSKISLDVFLYEIFAVLSFSLYFVFLPCFIFLSIFNVVVFVLVCFLAVEDVRSLEVADEVFYILLFVNVVVFILNLDYLKVFSVLSLVILYHVVYVVCRGGIGYGDIKVFCVLVLNLDFLEGIYLFSFTFLWAGTFCIILLLLKKVKKGMKIPLLPFVAIGYFSTIIIREGFLW